MRKSTIYLFFLGIAMIVAMTCAGVVVLAQNANSSTTMSNSNTNTRRTGRRRGTRRPANTNTGDQASDATMNSNANMSGNANMGTGRRRGRRRPANTNTGDQASDATMNSNANMSGNANMGAGRRRGRRRAAAATEMSEAASKRTGRCDPSQQEQTDLSGTYTGKAKHGDEAPVDSTLTITGNTFTMTSGSESHSGSLAAVTTCGYTAVTIMIGDRTPPPPGPNPPPPLQTMSLRAKKVGDKLWLTSVPGEKMSVSFTPTGGPMKPKPRRHRSTKKTETAPPTTP
ncbi:MAG: hypothetical protein ABR607_06555 [Pyrinomonadaceae bacterium]